MNKTLTKMMMTALLVLPFGLALPAQAATTWDVTGTYVITMDYLGTGYPHDMSLAQDASDNLTGNGGSPAGANVYTWVITSGSVNGNTIDFLANYTATPDAVVPQTVLHVVGTIAGDGTMSGTWSDNYQGGERSGTWESTSGVALGGELSAEDFGVVDYDTGLGQLAGYTAGFGLTDATLAGATSVVVKLYSGPSESDLLQTNTAILPKFNADITGTQFSSPFDVSGTFDYTTDGYWVNVRESQYGQSVPATRVVATVTLANGKVVTAENTNLTGDPTTIYPPVAVTYVTTDAATNIGTSSATLNGTNGDEAATGHSFWVSLAPFATTSPVIPASVYSTVDLGPIAANTSFSAALSSATGMPAVTADTTYYFAAWGLVDGTWYPGEILSFTTDEVVTPPPPTTGPTDKNQCKKGGWMTFTDPTFKNQGQCVSYVERNEHADEKNEERHENENHRNGHSNRGHNREH